jgi:hypothetical protein
MTDAPMDKIELPEVAEGHWSTPDGRDMAASYLGKTRAELCHGELSDLELANAIFMADRHELNLIGFQEAAKQRIRWLSARLAAYEVMTRSDGDVVTAIIKDVCELPGDADGPDALNLTVSDLRVILERNLSEECGVFLTNGSSDASLTQSSVQPDEEAYARREIREACKPTGEDHRRY